METKDGAALRKRREMAGFSLEDIQELIPSISYARLSRVERGRAELSPTERSDLDRLLSSRLRQRAAEFAEYMRESDQAVAV